MGHYRRRHPSQEEGIHRRRHRPQEEDMGHHRRRHPQEEGIRCHTRWDHQGHQDLQAKLEYEIEHNAARVYPEQYQRLGLFSRLGDYLAYGMLRLGVLLTGKASLY